ncbi:MAG TPA: sugar ABC transporter substrate-binding protein [Acetobacteraceae bacterium]|nr:sugar ABC transporter substrate-binding protein [Acetobacteraceae bacterium]
MSLELTTWQYEEPGFSTWWKELVAAFNDTNPNVHISMTGIANKDYQDQLTIRFASNRPPQLLELSPDNIGAYASQDWLMPLDDRIKGTPIETDWSSLQKQCVWGGKTQGVLLMSYAFMMFYNDALLDAAGVNVPTSWEEFLTAVPKVTDRAKGIFGLSAVTTEYVTISADFLRNIIWSGGSLLKGDKYNLTDPKVIAAMERYRSVVGGNAPLGQNSTVIRQLFVDGKTGFLVDGPWVYTLIEKATPATRPHLHMVKAPFSPPIGGAGNSIHIAAGLDRAAADAAWSFILFLAQPQWQQRYTEVGNVAAPRRGVITPEIAKQRPELVQINDSVVGAINIAPQNKMLQANYNEFNHIIVESAVKVISTTVPIAQIMKETQDQLDRAVPLT